MLVVTWYMRSEYKKDREKGTLDISQTQSNRNVVDRFGITKTSPIPGSPSLELRYVNDEEPVVDANVRENLGSLMWIAKQTRLDYAQKAEDRRSVSGVVGCCGGTLVSWFSRISTRIFVRRCSLRRVLINTAIFCWGYTFSVVKCFR